MQPAIEAGLFTGPAFVAHVNLAGWIVANENGGQPRANPVLLGESGRFRRNLRLHGLGQLLTVQQNCGHSLLLS